MARKPDLPGFYQKRKILFGAKTAPAKMRETGKLFMDAGRYDDALEFFERCSADDLARQIAAMAMKAGDTALYMRAKKVLKEQISDQEWAAVAANAEKAGAHTMAYVAHLRAGHEEEAARLRAVIGAAGGVQEPAAGPQQTPFTSEPKPPGPV
jgi:hypothetical protein